MKPHRPSLLVRGQRRLIRSIKKSTALLRNLPHFIIFGAARCGTTSLYNYLTAHPQVMPATVKEISFFDAHFDKGLAWYQSHFPLFLHKYYKGALVTGEATPSYIHHPAVPARIQTTLPHVKLILLLRNPINRAYSHYTQAVKLGKESLSFEIAVELQQMEIACFEKAHLFGDEKHLKRLYHPNAYLAKSIYVDNLKYWFATFPRQQILVLSSEAFYQNPDEVLDKTLNFLELPAWKPQEYKKYNYQGAHFAAKTKPTTKVRYEPINTATKAQLVDYFRPYNERLYEDLGIHFDWENQ